MRGACRWKFAGCCSQHLVAVTQFNRDFQRASKRPLTVQEHAYINATIVLQNVDRFRENILEEGSGDDAETDIPINSSKCQVINFATKWWNVFAFGRVDLNRQHVVAAPIDVRRDLKREGRITTEILTQAMSVNTNNCCRHHTVEVDKDTFSAHRRRELEMTTIEGNELI